jgi:uncharacterized protein YggE
MISRALALAALLAAASPLPTLAQSADSDRMFEATTLTLSAHGETKITPDQATITLGVQTTAPTAADAVRQNAARMSAITAALRAQSLPDRDIQTSNLSLNAQYTYAQDQPPRLNGYQASNDVTVIVEDIAKLGPIVDAVSAAGANQINGISFGLRDSTAAEDQARLAAVKALKAKADLYAQATGYHTERLVNLSEGAPQEIGPVRPMFRMAAEAVAAAPPTPVSAGELTVGVDVTGVYELAK